ncbi:MAG TPA: ABC transporter substrate-binding protein [Burkholderiaceae bacterium]|nr:ABC transporter substrate-binding protein [Burkholderiaceae bacterium]
MKPSRRSILLGLLALPRVTLHAQPASRSGNARIGILSGLAGNPEAMQFYAPITVRLAELGFVEGRNLEVDWRFAEGKLERAPALAAELLARKPDVLVAVGPVAKAAAAATQSVPVVVLLVNDPVVSGFAQSMARPGGNVTGVSTWGIELVAKRLQLLKELAPDVKRAGLFDNAHSVPMREADRLDFERRTGLAIVLVRAGGPDEFDAAFATLARERVTGLIVFADPMIYLNRARIAQLCAQHKMLSVWGHRSYLDVGGLASYQSDFAEALRRGGAIIDKILRGAKPGEIPFEQATRLELVVNLKAAKALGITVPASLLLAADEVIE